MEKKNPYITTVGFKKEDPDHVFVAELLNSMGRGKAQYIVKAVLCYQSVLANGGQPGPAGGGMVACDYAQIRQMVYQVLKEMKTNGEEVLLPKEEEQQNSTENKEQENSLLSGLDEDAMSGILASIAAFQAQ